MSAELIVLISFGLSSILSTLGCLYCCCRYYWNSHAAAIVVEKESPDNKLKISITNDGEDQKNSLDVKQKKYGLKLKVSGHNKGESFKEEGQVKSLNLQIPNNHFSFSEKAFSTGCNNKHKVFFELILEENSEEENIDKTGKLIKKNNTFHNNLVEKQTILSSEPQACLAHNFMGKTKNIDMHQETME